MISVVYSFGGKNFFVISSSIIFWSKALTVAMKNASSIVRYYAGSLAEVSIQAASPIS